MKMKYGRGEHMADVYITVKPNGKTKIRYGDAKRWRTVQRRKKKQIAIFRCKPMLEQIALMATRLRKGERLM